MADDEPPAIHLPGGPRRVEADRPDGTLERQRLPCPERRHRRRPAGIPSGHCQLETRPRVPWLDRGVGAERDERPALDERAPWVATRLGPGAPGAPCRLGVHPQVDRLDGCGDPRRPNRGTSTGSASWTCSRRGVNAVRPTVGSRASRQARTAPSPMAWIWVAIPCVAARSASAAEPLGWREEQAERSGRRRRAIGLGLEWPQHRRRARREGAVGEELHPPDLRPIVTGRERVARTQATTDRRLEGLFPDAGVDAQGQATCLVRAGHRRRSRARG